MWLVVAMAIIFIYKYSFHVSDVRKSALLYLVIGVFGVLC